jgi:HEAT repeat protein
MRGSRSAGALCWFVCLCAGFGSALLIADNPRQSAGDRRAGSHTIDEVAAGLRAPDPRTRLRAIQILSDAGYPEAAAPLAVALSDPDDRVKLAAIDAERTLFRFKPAVRRKKVGFVIELRSAEGGGEDFSAGRLAVLPHRVPAEVLSGLAGAFRAANPRVRLEALYVFGGLAPLGGDAAGAAVRSGVSWMMETLRRGNKTEQTAAAVAMGRTLESCGVDMTGAADPSGSLCAQAGNALVETVNSPEPGARRGAMVALGHLRYSNAVQALADQLSYYQRGPDAAAALAGLAGIGDGTSVELFKRALSGADASMRRMAVEGLGRSGGSADLPDLQELTRTERSNEVLLALHYASLKLGAPIALNDLVGSLSDSKLRPLAIDYLLDLSQSKAVALSEFLRTPDTDTRMLVADILGFSRDPAMIPALGAAGADPDPDVARAARRAIDRITLFADVARAPSRR